jgi:hypothetical protein
MIDSAHFLHALRRQPDLVADAPAEDCFQPLHVSRLDRIGPRQVGGAVIPRKRDNLVLRRVIAHQRGRRFFCPHFHAVFLLRAT